MSATTLLNLLDEQTRRAEAIVTRLQRWLDKSRQLREVEAERVRLEEQVRELENRLGTLQARRQELEAMLSDDAGLPAATEALAQLQQATTGLAISASSSDGYQPRSLRSPLRGRSTIPAGSSGELLASDTGHEAEVPPADEERASLSHEDASLAPRDASLPRRDDLFADLFSGAEELGDTSDDWGSLWDDDEEDPYRADPSASRRDAGLSGAEEAASSDSLLLPGAESILDEAGLFPAEWPVGDAVPEAETGPAGAAPDSPPRKGILGRFFSW